MTTVSRSEITITNINDGKTPYFHTAYTNSTNFGAHDYSGNPNLMRVIKASDFKSDSDDVVSDVGYNSIRVTSQGVNRLGLFTLNKIPSLVNGKTYTISAKIKFEEGSTGDINKLRVSYRQANSGAILINARSDGAEVGKEIIIKGTATVNYVITDVTKFYLTIDTDAGAKINGSVIVSDIKIEEGSTATPYQPNLLDAPWYFSTVSLGENIADPTVSFPIKTSAYRVYNANMLEEFEIGQRYTLTMKATKTASQTFRAYNGEYVPLEIMTPVEGLVDVWTCSFTALRKDSNSPRLLSIYQFYKETLGPCQIDWLKIEKGDTRTPNIDDYKYLGNYTDFVQADSLNPTKYSWSQIKGDAGEAQYTHIAYANSADGVEDFTTVYPNLNLLDGTKDFSGTWKNSSDWVTDGTYKGLTVKKRTWTWNGIYKTFTAPKDGVYTFSAYIKSSGNSANVMRYGAVNSTSSQATIQKPIGNNFDWTRDSVTLNLRANDNVWVRYEISGTGTDSYLWTAGHKYELNSTDTPYMPSDSEVITADWPIYIGQYTDFTQADSTNPSDYTWSLIRGNDGSDGKSAKTLILSTSSNTVKINQDSSIQSDTITLQANMQNMVGTATFSAIPYIGTAPQTAITLGGTGNIRTFSTSSWNKNWTSLVVTATFESFIDKQTIISVKEGKDGTDSITGLLTNESVTLAADKNGTVESFSEASGTFKVFDGLSDVTGINVAYRLKSSLGGTFNINASTGVYNMTAMSKDSATAIFEATYKNIKIEKILNVAKSKAGKETYTYTKYSNSKDFGDYDYSGNPNLLSNITNDSWTAEGAMKVTAVGDYLELVKDTPGRYGTAKIHNIPGLRTNSQYTTSLEFYLKSGTSVEDLKRCNIAIEATNTSGQVFYSVIYMSDIPKMDEWVDLTSTFTTNTYTDNLTNWKFRVYVHPDVSVSMRIKNNIKIEKGNKATPYQPNLLDEPWRISTVPVGENIRRLDAGNQPPLTTTEYNCYIGRINGYWKAGETYTITVEGTKPATQTFGLYLLNGSQHAGDLSPVEGLPDTWSLTFMPTKEMIDVGVTNHANIFQVPQSTKGEVKINSVKIEKGKYRTPEIDPYKYMGIYVGGESEQPHDPTQYAWSQIKGNDSTSYSLLLSSQVMSLPRGASKLVPENITISGMAQTGEKSIENINSRIVVEETTNGTTWTTKYDADALTYTYTPSSLNVLSARVKMYVAGAKNVQLDQKSINIVKDGSNGSNGSSSYTWIRYSENANGNPMTTTPNSKTKYIGIAITQTSTAPSAYGDYTWSRIKGSGGLVAKVYSNGGTNIEQSPIQINVETQSDGDIVEPNKVTWYMSKDSSVEWTAITAGNGITLNKKYIVVEPVVFLESNSISFKAQVEYNSMTAFDYMTVNNKSFDATKPLILRQPAAPLNPYPGLLWLDTSSGSGDPLDKTNPSLVYRWGKSAVENVIGTEYAHYAYANTPTGYQEDGVTPDPSFSVTYNSSQKPMYIGHCVTDTEPDPTTPSSYNWKSITTENGSEDVNGARGIAQEKIETTYVWGWVVLSASDLEMLPWLNNEDGSTIIDWIYQITQKTSDDSIVQTVVGSEDMSKVYAKTDAVDELSSANHELSDKIEEYNKQMQDAFAGIDTTYVNKSEFEQEMNKFNFGIDKAGGVNLIRNSTGFQWEDTAPSDEMLTNPKFEGTISTTGLDNGWVYNATGIGQVIGAESDFPENKIMRIGGTNSPTKYSYSKNVPVSPGQLINISGQVRIPNTIGNTKNAYLSIRFYAAGSDPSFNAASQTIGNGQGVITLFTDKTDFAGTIFETDSYAVKTNNIVQDIWSNYSVNVTIPPGAAFMKVLLYNDSTTPTNYFDFRKPSVVLYSGMFDFWHKNDSANAQIRQILGDESLEELGLIAGFELKGLRYKLDQDILLPNPNTEYTLSWYANKISQSGTSKYYVKVLNTKTGAEIAVSEASADTIGYQRMSVTFSVTNTSAVTIRIGLEGEGSADATLSAAGLMINIGPYPLSWQSHHEEVYSTNVRIDSSGLKVFNSDYDGYNVMTPREFAGYYRNGEVYERVFTLNKDTTKVKKLEAQERFMMKPVQIVSVDSPTIQGWAFVGYNGEDTD